MCRDYVTAGLTVMVTAKLTVRLAAGLTVRLTADFDSCVNNWVDS